MYANHLTGHIFRVTVRLNLEHANEATKAEESLCLTVILGNWCLVEVLELEKYHLLTALFKPS